MVNENTKNRKRAPSQRAKRRRVEGVGRKRDGSAWNPTELQQAAAAYCRDHDYNFTITALAKALNTDRKTYYRWFKGQAFVEWWRAGTQEHFVRQLPRVYSAMLKAALGSKTMSRSAAVAQKLFLEQFDMTYAPRARQDVSLKGQLDHRLSDEKLERLCQDVVERFAQDTAGTPPHEMTPDGGDHIAG